MKRKAACAIAGVGSTAYYFRGHSAPQTLYELVCKAILAAVDDAGLKISDVDGLAFYAGGLDPGLITESLNIPTLRFAGTVAGYGGGSAGVIDMAAVAVESGRARNVVCVGACQQGLNRYGVALTRFPPSPERVWERAEGGPFVESGAIRLDRTIPVNPHGGHLSEAYVIGMTHIREAVEQLRATAVNQIPDAHFALVTGGPAPNPMSELILTNRAMR